MAFGEWIVNHDWDEVKGNPSEMANALGNTLDQAMQAFFPGFQEDSGATRNPGSILI